MTSFAANYPDHFTVEGKGLGNSTFFPDQKLCLICCKTFFSVMLCMSFLLRVKHSRMWRGWDLCNPSPLLKIRLSLPETLLRVLSQTTISVKKVEYFCLATLGGRDSRELLKNSFTLPVLSSGTA